MSEGSVRTPRDERAVSTLLALAERCEREGWNRELDADIYIAMCIPMERVGRIDKLGSVVGWWPKDAPYESAIDVPRYTSSLDAAMTLVPDGCGIELSRYWLKQPPVRWSASLLWGTGGEAAVVMDATSPALALCAAALRARAAASRREATTTQQGGDQT